MFGLLDWPGGGLRPKVWLTALSLDVEPTSRNALGLVVD